MSEMITAFIRNMSAGFFVRQMIVITMLFLFGYFIVAASVRKKPGLYEVLLCFPAGLSAYSLISFVLLVTGIPFQTFSITLICAVTGLVCLIILCRHSYWKYISVKRAVIITITLLFIVAISTSGIIPVSISNDSLYYYHMYPNALVHNGGLRTQFNVFLTDVGQTSAIINTLPFVYGFDEGFGIQSFLNINTLIILVYALYEQCRRRLDRGASAVAACLLAALLVCSMSYIVMSVWAMSNGYFMCFMFICVYTAWRNGTTDVSEKNGESLMILGLIFANMSMLRMEGCIASLILALCFSTLKYSRKQLFAVFLLPVLILSVMYDIKIFLFMKIDAPYTFLTPVKALIQLAAIVAVSVYVLLIRDRLPDKIRKHMGLVTVAGLLLINMLLFIYNRSLYIENVKAFISNISHQSGWGLFPMLIIGIYVLSFIATDKKTGYNTVYWDLCFIAYLLTAIAVSFARDDALRESIADSGNRVMLQVTLLAFFAAAMRMISLAGSGMTSDNDIIKITTDQEENRNG